MNKAKKLNGKNLSSIGVISMNKWVSNWNEKENGIVGKSIGVIVMANSNNTKVTIYLRNWNEFIDHK